MKPSLRAKRRVRRSSKSEGGRNPCRHKEVWIASSQELLAMTEYRVGRWAPSTSLRAQRSNPYRRTKKVWIASSQELLAMKEYRFGRWAPSTSLRAQRSNPYRRKESMDCFVASAPRHVGVSD